MKLSGYAVIRIWSYQDMITRLRFDTRLQEVNHFCRHKLCRELGNFGRIESIPFSWMLWNCGFSTFFYQLSGKWLRTHFLTKLCRSSLFLNISIALGIVSSLHLWITPIKCTNIATQVKYDIVFWGFNQDMITGPHYFAPGTECSRVFHAINFLDPYCQTLLSTLNPTVRVPTSLRPYLLKLKE